MCKLTYVTNAVKFKKVCHFLNIIVPLNTNNVVSYDAVVCCIRIVPVNCQVARLVRFYRLKICPDRNAIRPFNHVIMIIMTAC